MGFQGKKNVYICSKGHNTVTVDKDNGTTPMMIRCRQKHDDGKRNCTEMATSSFYHVDQSLIAEYEWYKPDSTKGLNQYDKEHVDMGGLLFRKIKQ